MPRFVVERDRHIEHDLDDGLLQVAVAGPGETCLEVVDNNAEEGVTWVTSYVTVDTKRTYCVYDGPNPDSIQKAALANGLPVDSVAEVRVLDPYFYTGAAQ